MIAPVSATLLLVAVLLGLVGMLVWADAMPTPVDLFRLTGDYLGAWCTFLALLCGYAAFTGARDESRVAFVTVALASGGAALAVVRTAL